MRAVLLAGVLALASSSSRAGCGTMMNSFSISVQDAKIAQIEKDLAATRAELAHAQAELASRAAYTVAQNDAQAKQWAWTQERMRALDTRINELQQKLDASGGP